MAYLKYPSNSTIISLTDKICSFRFFLFGQFYAGFFTGFDALEEPGHIVSRCAHCLKSLGEMMYWNGSSWADRGVVWNTEDNPTLEENIGSFLGKSVRGIKD